MGHQPKYISGRICDSGNVGNGSIGIVVVFQSDYVIVLKGFERACDPATGGTDGRSMLQALLN